MSNPWDSKAGAYDRPSSSTPTAPVPETKTKPQAEKDASGRVRVIASIAGQLVGEYGLAAACTILESAEEAVKETQRDATAAELLSYVERVENLIDQRVEINAGIKSVLKEASHRGFDIPTMRTMIKRREKDRDEVLNGDALLAIYEESVGGLPVRVPIASVEPDTPAPTKKESARNKALREARAFANATSTTTH